MSIKQQKEIQNKPNGSGIKRLWKATQCSFAGIRAGWIHEAAFRQELLLCLILAPIAIWLADTAMQWLIMTLPLLLLLVVESINSAIEAAIDRISRDYHELSGRAKDLGSTAVFFTVLIGVCCWGAVLLPRLMN